MAEQGLRSVVVKKYNHHANHGTVPDDKENILSYCSFANMAVAFFKISFSILRRWISFWRALYSLRVTVSSSDTLLCSALKFPRSTYYKALVCVPSNRQKEYKEFSLLFVHGYR